MKTRLHAAVRPSAARPKAQAPSQQAAHATLCPARNPPRPLPLPHAVHAPVRHAAQALQTALLHLAVATGETVKTRPNVRDHPHAAQVRQIVLAQNVAVTVVIVKNPLSAPARHVVRDQTIILTLLNARGLHAARVLATAPVPRIVQGHPAVQALLDALARRVVVDRESPVAQVRASHAEWESRFAGHSKR